MLNIDRTNSIGMATTEDNAKYLSDKQDVGGGFNHNQVRLDYDWEVIYWCMVLQCTKEQLVAAVEKVGTSAALLRQVLKN